MTTPFPGTGRTDYAGYTDCIFLENGDTRVVLGHPSGGRVLEYAHHDENALYLDPGQSGKIWKPNDPVFSPKAGRFDIGPEKTVPGHPLLWAGEWTAEIIGPRAAKLTSQVDPAMDLQLVGNSSWTKIHRASHARKPSSTSPGIGPCASAIGEERSR